MSAYYSENDPLKAEVLREAIRAGAIAPGDVDERSIKDVRAADLVGYRQCHFFAGGGFWSLALRWAGWPDDEPAWTGSCPCPSFSCAGKGGGFDDPRHLWPDWARLIGERRPAVLFGEQSDDAVGFGWLDLVQTDLEAQAYAVGKMVFGAHSLGAPHIRQRLYFVADTSSERHDGRWAGEAGGGNAPAERCSSEFQPQRSRHAGHVADTDGGESGDGDLQRGGEQRLLAPDRGTGDGGHSAQRGFAMRGSAPGNAGHAALSGESSSGHDTIALGRGARRHDDASHERELAHAAGIARGGLYPVGAGLEGHFGDVREWRGPGWLDPQQARSAAEAGATRGPWADCDWWYGRDGKYRPIEPGVFPLAHGYPNRVGLLRLAGDAIVVSQAQAFIEAYLATRRL